MEHTCIVHFVIGAVVLDDVMPKGKFITSGSEPLVKYGGG